MLQTLSIDSNFTGLLHERCGGLRARNLFRYIYNDNRLNLFRRSRCSVVI